MDTRRVAVIDLGSNSFKLLVAQGASVARIFEAYEDVRLLEKSGAGAISSEKLSRGIRAVSKLVELAREHAPDVSAIVGTSVFRTATNADISAYNSSGKFSNVGRGTMEKRFIVASIKN